MEVDRITFSEIFYSYEDCLNWAKRIAEDWKDTHVWMDLDIFRDHTDTFVYSVKIGLVKKYEEV